MVNQLISTYYDLIGVRCCEHSGSLVAEHAIREWAAEGTFDVGHVRSVNKKLQNETFLRTLRPYPILDCETR